MPKRPHRPSPAEDFASGPDYDREFTRPGPDYADLGKNGGHENQSFGGVPREYPHPNFPPNQIHSDSVREGLAPQGPRSSHPYERGVREALGAAPRPNYPFADIASAARRGKFFGRGPK